MTFDPLTMSNYVEKVDGSKTKCGFCAKFVASSKIKRHLQTFHKIVPVVAKNISKSKTTKHPKVTCFDCGVNVTDLKKHKLAFHKITQKTIAAEILDSKQENVHEGKSFSKAVTNFKDYAGKTRGYKEETMYDPKRYENLARINKVLIQLGHDPDELISIAENDIELERSAELTISDYINNLKDLGRTSETARCYLNDLKIFLSHIYRYRSRRPLIQFLDMQLQICKKASLGKMNLVKYSGEEGEKLIAQLQGIDHCEHVLNQLSKLETSDNGNMVGRSGS